MGDRIGPSIEVKRSCQDCVYCRSAPYRVQGDSGCDVTCQCPTLAGGPDDRRRSIGDTTWKTPGWCPFTLPAHDEKGGGRKVRRIIGRKIVDVVEVPRATPGIAITLATALRECAQEMPAEFVATDLQSCVLCKTDRSPTP